jgi:prepilin-type N-terminal cleavage/methylation domain-containing protein
MVSMAPATTYAISGGRSAGRARTRVRRGVTLVEMLVVVGIIVLLAGMVISLVRRVDDQSKEKALNNAFALLKGALQEYYGVTDAFPVQADLNENSADVIAHAKLLYDSLYSVPASRQVLQQISQVLVKGSVDQAAADPMKVYDPWGTVIDYRYIAGNNFPELISAGPDKKFDTADDISSKNL